MIWRPWADGPSEQYRAAAPPGWEARQLLTVRDLSESGVDNVHILRFGSGRTAGGLGRIAYVFWSSQCLQGPESGSSPTSGTRYPLSQARFLGCLACVHCAHATRECSDLTPSGCLVVAGRSCGRGFLSVGLIDVLAFHCFMVLTGRSNMTWFARGRGAAADCVFLFASTLQRELRAVLHSSLRLRRQPLRRGYRPPLPALALCPWFKDSFLGEMLSSNCRDLPSSGSFKVCPVRPTAIFSWEAQ
jgi:hypothetical protein